jgi:tetratricopeptide (TPR) repeat protein
MFAGLLGRDRSVDAREELNAAASIDPNAQAAHVGLGIMRSNERSANRAKTEFLAALRTDANNVLAREYLGTIYQVDLRNPEEGLKYVVGVPNLVPGYADIQFHLASIMQDLKLYDDAVRYAKAGIALDTGRVGEAGQHGYVLIAQILLQQKKVPEAKRYLQQAVAYDADGIFAKKLLDKIAKGDYDDKSAPTSPPKR